MRRFLRFLLLIICYVLVFCSGLFAAGHRFDLDVFNKIPKAYNLYVAAGTLALGLLFGLILVFAGKTGPQEDEDEETLPVRRPAEEDISEEEEEPEEEAEIIPAEEAEETEEVIMDEQPQDYGEYQDDITTVFGAIDDDGNQYEDNTTFLNTSEIASLVDEDQPGEIDDLTTVFEPLPDETEVLTDSVDVPRVIVSPLGPKPAQEPEEPQEETAYEETAASQPEEPEQEEKVEVDLWPNIDFDSKPVIQEDDEVTEVIEEEPAESDIWADLDTGSRRQPEEQVSVTQALSKTQEDFIQKSDVSYIDTETGLPKFRLTETMDRLDIPEEEINYDQYERDVEREDRFNNFLNNAITFLLIVLVLIGIYLAYVRFFS